MPFLASQYLASFLHWLLLFATRGRDTPNATRGPRPRVFRTRAVDLPGHNTAAQQLAQSSSFFREHETLGLN